MENKKEITEQDLIDACRYGYDYHKTSQFPETKFEEFCMNNFKQLLESKKLKSVLDTGDENKLREYVNNSNKNTSDER